MTDRKYACPGTCEGFDPTLLSAVRERARELGLSPDSLLRLALEHAWKQTPAKADAERRIWPRNVRYDVAGDGSGEVRDLNYDPPKVLKQKLTNGYPYVYPRSGGIFVHTIVCEAWHGEKPFARATVSHEDSDKTNNHPDNLKWRSHSSNTALDSPSPPHRVWTDAEAAELRERFARGGISQSQLAREQEVSQVAIANMLSGQTYRKAGGPLHVRATSRRRSLTEEQEEQVLACMRAGSTGPEVAELLGVSLDVVRGALARQRVKDTTNSKLHRRIKRAGSASPRAKFEEHQVREIRERFAKGKVQVQELAAEFSVSSPSMSRLLCGYSYKDAGGPLHEPSNKNRKLSDAQVIEIGERFDTGLTQKEIAAEFGVSVRAVQEALHHFLPKLRQDT